MTIFGHLLEEGAGEERECADYPSLCRTKPRATSFNGTTGRRIEPVQGIWSRLSVLISQATLPNLRLCPTLHRLMTFCWQVPLSGHRDAISVVHVPFLKRLPLGPQDAFARCV